MVGGVKLLTCAFDLVVSILTQKGRFFPSVSWKSRMGGSRSCQLLSTYIRIFFDTTTSSGYEYMLKAG